MVSKTGEDKRNKRCYFPLIQHVCVEAEVKGFCCVWVRVKLTVLSFVGLFSCSKATNVVVLKGKESLTAALFSLNRSS